MNKDTENHFSINLAGEIGLIFTYLLLWLFPVIASLFISFFGLKFSYVATFWQDKNLQTVGACILISFLSGSLTAILTLVGLKKNLKGFRPKALSANLGSLELIILCIILMISSIGLFKSFPSTIFNGIYAGPTSVWLNYGAWSVTFLLALNLILGQILVNRPLNIFIIFFTSILFTPFLLSGSRIDFLSFMLVLVVAITCATHESIKVRAAKMFFLAIYVMPLILYISTARYQLDSTSSPYILSPIRSEMFYLSTFGDLGVSVFQIIGLILELGQEYVGFGDALSS